MTHTHIISVNPATLEEIGNVPITIPEAVSELVERARRAQPVWAALSYTERGSHLLKAREYLLNNINKFARTITEDNGKPLVESLTAEIYPIADLLYYFARNTKRLFKNTRICTGVWELMFRQSRIGYQPLGVVGIVSPWNYPFSIPAGTAAMALMAGNAVLLKPSSATPLVGNKIAELFESAGLPKDVFIHLPGDAATGQALIESKVDKVVFTGSVGIGKHVMATCAKNLTPCTLELGGKDPMIVRSDAQLEHASSGAVWGAFTNSGQCCASIERVYVHESVAEAFIQKVVDKTNKLRQGLGINYDTDIGPMTTESQLKTVEAQVEEAKKQGATILTGGERNTAFKGWFYKPTVLTNVDHTFTCVRDETFGPLMPIMTYRTDEEAIELANDSSFGLNAYIWTSDIKKGRHLARQLKCGTVVINDCVYTHALPQTPWGGIKESGFGRTHSKFGLLDLVNIHHIHTNPVTFIKDMWWYRYSESAYEIFRELTKKLTGCWCKKITALPSLIRAILREKI